MHTPLWTDNTISIHNHRWSQIQVHVIPSCQVLQFSVHRNPGSQNNIIPALDQLYLYTHTTMFTRQATQTRQLTHDCWSCTNTERSLAVASSICTHTQQYLTYRHRLAYTQLLVMYKYRTIPAVAYSICTHTTIFSLHARQASLLVVYKYRTIQGLTYI